MMKDDKLYRSRPKGAQTPRECPKCGKKYRGYPALSREDNKTAICSECGIIEAVLYFISNRNKQMHLDSGLKSSYN